MYWEIIRMAKNLGLKTFATLPGMAGKNVGVDVANVGVDVKNVRAEVTSETFCPKNNLLTRNIEAF